MPGAIWPAQGSEMSSPRKVSTIAGTAIYLDAMAPYQLQDPFLRNPR